MDSPAPRTSTPITARDGAQTENRIQVQTSVLKATEQLLSEGNAYADLSVDRIAKAAGISRTAFYFYFADKRELMTGLAAQLSQELFDQAIDFFSGEADSTDDLKRVLGGVYDLYLGHGAVVRAVVEVSTYDEEIAIFWRGLLNSFIDAVEGRIERGRGTGSSSETPARGIAFALVWMTERSLYQQLVQQEPVGRSDMIAALVEIFEGSRQRLEV
jgi:AcrR family transcriptional regulator